MIIIVFKADLTKVVSSSSIWDFILPIAPSKAQFLIIALKSSFLMLFYYVNFY